MNVAIIKNNKVVNIAVFDDLETAEDMYPEAILIDADTTPCGIGWSYDPIKRECIALPVLSFNNVLKQKYIGG